MKRTSWGSRLVRMAARSPARSSTGPEVWRRLTPISWAMMWASVVLPRPGAEEEHVVEESARFLAASMKISLFANLRLARPVVGRRLAPVRRLFLADFTRQIAVGSELVGFDHGLERSPPGASIRIGMHQGLAQARRGPRKSR